MRIVTYRPDPYTRLLTADPPICRNGPALATLRRCEANGRGACRCRLRADEIADDLNEAGLADLADYLDDSLEPEDVEELVTQLRATDLTGLDPGLADRLVADVAALSKLVDAGSGLTDRYAEDLD